MKRITFLLAGAAVLLTIFFIVKKGGETPAGSQAIENPGSSEEGSARTMAFDSPTAATDVTALPAEIASAGPDPQPVPPGADLNHSPGARHPVQPPGTHISHGGPMGTVELPNPPERLAGSGGSPEEVIAFEKIRSSMPNAYMVRESNSPPPGLASEFPGEAPAN